MQRQKSRLGTAPVVKWLVILPSTFILAMQVSLITTSFAVLLDSFLVTFQQTQAVIGILGAVRLSLAAFVGTMTGPLVHRFGCRPVAVVGIFLTTLGHTLAFFSNNFAHLFITFGIVGGVGNGCLQVPIQVIIQQHFRNNRALAAGLASAGLPVGFLVMGPITRLLIDYYGWRGALLLQGGMSAQTLIAACLLYPPQTSQALKDLHKEKSRDIALTSTDGRENDELEDTGEQGYMHSQVAGKENDEKTSSESVRLQRIHSPDTKHKSQEAPQTTDQSLCTPPFCLTIFRSVCSCFDTALFDNPGFVIILLAAMPSNSAPIANRSYDIQRSIEQGIKPSDAAFLSMAWGIGSVLGRVGLGIIGNMRSTNRPLLYAFAITTCGVSAMVSVTTRLHPSIEIHIIFAVIGGMSFGGFAGIQSTVLVEMVGLTVLPKPVGLLLLPRVGSAYVALPLTGLLFDIYGDYTRSYLLMAGLQCVGGVLALVAAIVHTCRTVPARQNSSEEKR